MKLKLLIGRFFLQKRLLQLIMKLYVFLLCTIVFGFSPVTSSSQEKITIKKDCEITVNEVFRIIKTQSDYSFIYPEDMFNNAPKITLNKGAIQLNELLNKALKSSYASFTVKENNVIYIKANSSGTVAATNPTGMQNHQVTGTVSDANGQPLPGANVIEKGTTNGTQTDFDGNFNLNVNDGNAVLIISYVGFKTQEVAVKNQSTIKINLSEDAAALDEVVVVGYGTRLKGEVTGSISKVKSEVFESRPFTNTLNSLQGELPGVTVTRSSGQPGAQGLNFNIRGVSSINGNAPLVLIDGIPGSMSTLNPSDIKEVTVLKDAAAAIYGARAASGVLLITTKSGKNQKPSVTYSTNFASKTPSYFYKIVNTSKLVNMFNEAMGNIGLSGASDDVINKIRNNASPDLDRGWNRYLENWPGFYGSHQWMNDIYGVGTQQLHNLSINGGNDDSNYLVSVGYKNDNGIISYGKLKSDIYNLRLNFSTKLFNDKLRLDTRTSFENMVNVSPSQLGSGLSSARLNWPYVPIKNPEGNYYWYQNYRNPAQLLEQGGDRNENVMRLGTNFKAELNLAKGLILTGQAGVNLTYNNSNTTNRNFNLYDWQNEVIGSFNNPNSANYFNAKNVYSSLTSYLEYNTKILSKHSISAMIGASHEQDDFEHQSTSGYNFVSNDIFTLNLADKTDVAFLDNTGSHSDWALNSYFTRLSYTFNKKLNIDFTARLDGSSKFAPDKRWSAIFPAVLASYDLSDVPFIASSNSFDLLKIRASWGRSGNQNLGNVDVNNDGVPDDCDTCIGNYDYIPLINISGNYPIGSPNVGLSGADASITSSQRTWETVETKNVGLDFNVLDFRLQGSFDYFIKDNKDMLVNVALPATLGGSAPTQNVGQLQTKGWDLSLGWNDTKGDLKYSAQFIISDSKTTLTRLEGNDAYFEGLVKTRENYPLNSYFGYESAGIIKTQEQLDAYKQLGNVPSRIGLGDVMYKDLDGDGKITSFGDPSLGSTGDLKYLGDTNPRFTYSGNFRVSYKMFDFSAFLQGVGKQSIARRGVLGKPYHFIWHPPLEWFYEKTWTPERPDAAYPRIIPGGLGWDDLRDWNYRYSDRTIENVSYLRVKSLILGCSLPPSVYNQIKAQSFRIYLSGEDLITFSKGTWGNSLDPESPKGEEATDSFYPFVKTISIGLDITF